MNNQTNVNDASKMSTAPKSTSDKKDDSFMDRAGDFIEKVGHKISDAGAPGIGQKIHDLGDKLEKQHKNPAHPHKV